MNAMVERIDDLGKGAWIGLMVLAFILFFPLGLALLAFLIWSGRMGCRSYSHQPAYGAAGVWGDNGRQNGDWQERQRSRIEQKIAHLQDKLARWGKATGGGARAGFAPTGNAAFDEYRDSTLKRLEDEAAEFQDFLKRLRAARDKEEFDAYMTQRRNGVVTPSDSGNPNN
ncbi:MAG: DUF2852 domain-containing protein [Beijerinckiaceae bacterium]